MKGSDNYFFIKVASKNLFFAYLTPTLPVRQAGLSIPIAIGRRRKIKGIFRKYLNRYVLLSIVFFGVFTETLLSQKLQYVRGNLELQRIHAQKQKSRLKAAPIDIIELPFIDDFSTTTIFPERKYWADSSVYINSTYASNLLTIGVATLDDINSRGYIYENATPTAFRADSLTSNPINLNYPGRQDIWLSFVYQGGGNIDGPGENDSLIVEFYSPGTQKWELAWDTSGFTSTNFISKSIPVNKPEHLQNGFQFRFRNLASVNIDEPGKMGIEDAWHLDYVRLDTGRFENDTIIQDVAFTKPLRSFLNYYQAIPFNHFEQTADVFNNKTNVTFRNNGDTIRYISGKYFQFRNLRTSSVSSFKVLGDTISGGITFNLQADYINPFESDTKDSVVFEITCYLTPDTIDDRLNTYDLKENDTIRYLQVFDNYFAYDDGSPENGLGIGGEGTANTRLAYCFNAYVTDTLKGIAIYFNPKVSGAGSSYYFKLGVWADNKGIPGQQLFISKDARNLDESEMNRYHTFPLDTNIIVNGKFYVGIIQINENDLNIGYDYNFDSRNKLFINLNGNWESIPIGIPGSLMMRPILRTLKNTVNIQDVSTKKSFSIYPNPARNFISVKKPENVKIQKVLFYNTIGQLVSVIVNPASESIDVSGLKAGIYFVKVFTNEGFSGTTKMIKEM